MHWYRGRYTLTRPPCTGIREDTHSQAHHALVSGKIHTHKPTTGIGEDTHSQAHHWYQGRYTLTSPPLVSGKIHTPKPLQSPYCHIVKHFLIYNSVSAGQQLVYNIQYIQYSVSMLISYIKVYHDIWQTPPPPSY